MVRWYELVISCVVLTVCFSGSYFAWKHIYEPQLTAAKIIIDNDKRVAIDTKLLTYLKSERETFHGLKANRKKDKRVYGMYVLYEKDGSFYYKTEQGKGGKF